MTRRHHIATLGGALAAPLLRAQPPAPEVCDDSGLWVPDLSCPPNQECEYRLPPASRPFTLPAANDTEDFRPPQGPVRQRRLWSEIKDDDESDKQLVASLEKGYRILRCRSERDPSDPTGLLYQARLHAFYCAASWPTGDVHNTGAFLPWHRAFTYFHERLLAGAIGQPEFRLPVWDWDRESVIPAFYRKLGLPSFISGPAGRNPNPSPDLINDCVMQAWLLSQKFEDFCGAPGKPGRASVGPHASVHARLAAGPMTKPITAAADPIFYTHHTNVDRYWSGWMRRYPNFTPPPGWIDQRFFFVDERRRWIAVNTAQLLRDADLGYEYSHRADLNFNLSRLPVKLSDLLNPGRLVSKAKAMFEVIESIGLHPKEWLKAVNAACQDSSTRLPLPASRMIFPLQMRVRVPAQDVTPGMYYLVQLQGRQAANLGGFGVFASGHPHGTGSQDEVELAVAGCADLVRIFCVIHNAKGPVKLVYGEADKNGSDIRIGKARLLAKVNLQLLHPSRS